MGLPMGMKVCASVVEGPDGAVMELDLMDSIGSAQLGVVIDSYASSLVTTYEIVTYCDLVLLG